MAEEIHDASRNLPRAILAAVSLNAFLSFLMVITLVFTMGDGGADDITGYPFITIFFNAVQHYGGVNAMVFLVIFGLTNCAISETATASRQVWSFARDNGLPFSHWLSQVCSFVAADSLLADEGLNLGQPGPKHSRSRRRCVLHGRCLALFDQPGFTRCP